MQKFYYFIYDNLISSDKMSNLPYNFSIVKIPIGFPIYPNTQKFTSLRQLKKYSGIYKGFMRVNPKGARRICEERFIKEFSKTIRTPSTSGFNNYSSDFLLHTILGKIEKDFSGLHLICEENRNLISFKEIKSPDINGVWEAEIEIFSNIKNKKFKKISTLFPKHWSSSDFMFEIFYAYENRRKENNFSFKGETKSGVPVKMIIKNNKLLSTFPLYVVD